MTRDPLSHRQLEIADGIRRGLSYAEIAGELACSPHTIRTHIARMAAKLRPLVIRSDEARGRFSPREIVSRWVQQRTAKRTA